MKNKGRKGAPPPQKKKNALFLVGKQGFSMKNKGRKGAPPKKERNKKKRKQKQNKNK